MTRPWRMEGKPLMVAWMRMETGAAHPAFGSLWRALHFCIATEGEPKMDHRYEASVGGWIGELQCTFSTHFGL
jgi:hypothetical protein